jgi:L-malate glycosyltransferase
MNDLHIGIAGPILVGPLRPYLDLAKASQVPLPNGLGGTSIVNLVLELLRRNRRVTVFSLDPAVDAEVVLQGKRLKICLGPYRARGRARDLFAVERAYLREAIRREKHRSRACALDL